MLNFVKLKRKASDEDNANSSQIMDSNINSENLNSSQPSSKKYKDRFQNRWFTQYTWLKYCSDNEIMTCQFCKDFSSKCFKTSTLSKHSSSTSHIRQEKLYLETEKNKKYMKTATNNAIKKADAEILQLIKTAYFIARNVSIVFFFLYFINVLFLM